MKLSSHSYFLEFIHPFVLAHGTRNGTNLVFVKIEHKGFIGYGEASLPPYRKETKESVTNWIESQRGLIEKILEKNPFEIESEMPFSEDNPAASSALQGAILNWYSTSNNKKLAHFFDIKNESPSLTLTVTKNEFKTISEKLKVARNFSHLKLKLTGDSDDFEFVKGLRGLTSKNSGSSPNAFAKIALRSASASPRIISASRRASDTISTSVLSANALTR